jgi:hypothetical protein
LQANELNLKCESKPDWYLCQANNGYHAEKNHS